jgi:hypothetical protein
MRTHKGAVVLLNAASGEILVMASHPNFDPNLLDVTGLSLSQDLERPLINRSAQGLYPPGNALNPLLIAAGLTNEEITDNHINLFRKLGFYSSPELRLPVTQVVTPTDDLLVSPLQLALAVAALSNDGLRPPARLAMAINSPQIGWIILPALTEPEQIYPTGSIEEVVNQLFVTKQPYWEFVSTISDSSKNQILTWYTAGTISDWQGTPLSIVVLLEEDNIYLAKDIGQSLINASLQP